MGVCDIYAAGSTPCVAAFSTVRALYGAYSGNLYQVTRADNTTENIGVVSPGGVANAATQDTFCSGTTCTISIIYDQSGKGNDLTKAPKGGQFGPNADIEAVANALPITIGGFRRPTGSTSSPPGPISKIPFKPVIETTRRLGSPPATSPRVSIW